MPPENKSLARVLLQVYAENKDPIHDQIGSLMQILPECDSSEKNNLLQLFGLVAKDRPKVSISMQLIVVLCSLVDVTIPVYG